VAAKFYGKPSRPELVPVGAYTETLGTITSSAGQAITPGNAADGSYISLGTTVKPLWWWQFAHQINNGTITAQYTYLELAWGDASNKKTFFKMMHAGTTGETIGLAVQEHLLPCAAYCEVPAGSTIYARARCNAAPDANYNVVALGVGG
jgi:hypothetical protein